MCHCLRGAYFKVSTNCVEKGDIDSTLLIIWCRKVSKLRDLCPHLSDRSEIWQASPNTAVEAAAKFQSDVIIFQYRGSDNSRRLMMKRLIRYWNGASSANRKYLVNCHKIVYNKMCHRDHNTCRNVARINLHQLNISPLPFMYILSEPVIILSLIMTVFWQIILQLFKICSVRDAVRE